MRAFKFHPNSGGGQILVASLLIVGLAALKQRPVECQAVDSRAALGDKQELGAAANLGGGQSRTIYSQKHLSPHRMMHFGKRPQLQAPPSLLVRSAAPAYQTDEVLAYEPLSQLFDEAYSSAAERAAQRVSSKPLIELVASMLEFSKQQQLRECVARVQEQQQQQQQQRTPSMKLLEANNNEEQANADAPEAQAAAHEKRAGSLESAPGQQLEQADASGFSVASRSLPQMGRELGLPSFTRAHLSSILYGRRLGEQPGSLLNLGSYIKKAEPQKMTFMHFG